jgi:hypothetical protein
VKGRRRCRAYGGFSFHDALDIFMRDFGGFGVDDMFGGGRAPARRPGVAEGAGHARDAAADAGGGGGTA